MGFARRPLFTSRPVGDGYEVEVTEFDYKDDGDICYKRRDGTPRSFSLPAEWERPLFRLDWRRQTR
jgi:ribonuclease Z